VQLGRALDEGLGRLEVRRLGVQGLLDRGVQLDLVRVRVRVWAMRMAPRVRVRVRVRVR